MFKVVILFLSIASGEIEGRAQTTEPYSKERCERILAHDLPIIKERTEAVAPNTYEVTASCVMEPGTEI